MKLMIKEVDGTVHNFKYISYYSNGWMSEDGEEATRLVSEDESYYFMNKDILYVELTRDI